ncbi:MAG: hypothetical protein JWN70_6850 [Planctomycetaceae bacterium]|nr:hypothetical protein [Planctomycetaceae bacterium]
MSRRGRSGPAISLFAFQDIITSVTAIVIVVVLFLALDLVQRKESAHADSPAGVVEDLTERIAELRAELERLQAETTRTDATVRELAQHSPAELQAEATGAERAVQDLQARLKQLVERHKLWQSREKAALARKFDLRPQQLQLEKSKQASRDLQQQVEEGRNDRRPIYGLPRGVSTGGWVVVIEEEVIFAAPLGRRAKPIKFQQGPLPLVTGTAASAFLRWIRDEKQQKAYFLLLIRPGGAEQAHEINFSFTEKSTLNGYDVIGAQEEILHPEKGAAP